MKKLKNKAGILLLVFVLVSACVGCGGVKNIVDETASKIIDEELPEQSIKEENTSEAIKDAEVVKAEMSEESIQEIIAETEEVPWSSDIPEVFEEFKDGYCLMCDNFKENDSDIWMLTFVDVDLNDVAEYNKKLEKNNWILEDEVSDLMYAFTKEDYETTITIGNNADGSLWYTLYLSYKAPNESGSDLNHMDEGDIPEGYPGDIPVYESGTSIIIGANEINAGGTIVYSIEIGCDETTEEIVKVIYPYLEKLNKDKATKIMMIGNALLQGGTDDWYYTIRIEAIEYKGKATSILYQVTPIAD